MKTKNNVSKFIALVSGLMIITNIGCKKYEDGPMLSFRSRTERVANTWKVDNYKLNGTDFTSLVAGYTETFNTDGNYSYSWGILSGTGKWEFQNNNKEIKISGIDKQSSETLYIQKLEEKQFWYYYFDGNDRKEFHMIQK